MAEAEKAKVAQCLVEAEEEEEIVIDEEAPAEIPAVIEPVSAPAEVAEPLPALDTAFVSPSPVVEKPKLRFAEDILAPGPTKPQAKSKKKKKKGVQERKNEEDGSGARKLHRESEIYINDDEDDDGEH